jgi:hypothetical protein
MSNLTSNPFASLFSNFNDAESFAQVNKNETSAQSSFDLELNSLLESIFRITFNNKYENNQVCVFVGDEDDQETKYLSKENLDDVSKPT